MSLNKKLITLLFTLTIVFTIYSFAINRTWQFFDESLLYKEELFPMANNLLEVFEIIKTYVPYYNVDS